MDPQYDVVVIGGGVIGTAIASRLSQTTARVCLVERDGDVAEGASKGNAGITSSYYAAPGTLEAQLTTASVFRWEDICERLNVPYRRVGALMPALNDEEAENLPALRDEALGCGVAAEIISGKAARQMEPMISPDCLSALHLPDEGIIDPMRLTFGYAELAAHNGADIRLRTPVIGLKKDNERIIEVITPEANIPTQFVVNAAGLHADTISGLADGDTFRMWPRKGQYWVLDREFGRRLQHIVFAAPAKETKGIHVVPTTNGSVLLGPSSEDQMDRYDKATDGQTLAYVFERTKRLVPEVSLDYAIKTFAALRPACEEVFFVRPDTRVPNLLHAVSRSIGVSTSPGIADYMLDLLVEAGLDLHEKADPVMSIPGLPPLRHTGDPTELDNLHPRYRQVVCVCEQVTAAEIEAALTAKVPAESVEGVRKRTGATGGRCQGSVCMAGVSFMCSMHTHDAPEDVMVNDKGRIGIG